MKTHALIQGFGTLGLVVVALLAAVRANGESPARVSDGLWRSFEFDAMPETLENHSPDDATIQDGVLRLRSDAKLVASRTESRDLIARIEKSQAITLEVWLRTSDWNQSGPARLITVSKNASNRNVTLGQQQNQFHVRLRRAGTDSNGLPGWIGKTKTRPDQWLHVVFTRSSDRVGKLFVDGRVIETKRYEDDLRRWDRDHRLVIGNELSGGRGWTGELALVAIYERALSDNEVRQNYSAGKDGRSVLVVADPMIAAGEHFERHIAPLLSRHCLECHDAASREGGLDLSHRSAAFAGGDSGDAILPNHADDSLVWTSVESDEMPHGRPALSDDNKKLLKDWIDGGAVWSVDFVDPAIYRGEVDSQRWVRRLTVDEVIETVRATFDVDVSADAKAMLPPDLRADGFRNTAYNLNVDYQHVDAYAKLADIVIERMDVPKFVKPFATNRTHTDKNMRPLVETMGRKILRGELSGDEVTLYRGVASTAALTGADFETAVGHVIRTMIQSPRFLYRVEENLDDAYEIASRLSYTLWGGPPDDELLRAASENGLHSDRDLREQLARMWKDPRSESRSVQFVSQWLDLDRLPNLNPDAKRFPDWTPELANDMRRETVDVFRELVWQQRRPLVELLNASYTYVSPNLARHYGMPETSQAWARVDLSDVPSRGGLLTHGSVLTIGGDNASMVTRGLFVLRDLLFSEVGDPPPGLDTTPVPTEPGLTHRSIAMDRVANESCGGCHKRFEPLAYGLEIYDGLGRYQTQDEHGNTLRQDGQILFPGDAEPIEYETAPQMMRLLAESDRVAMCLARKVIQFCIGRPLDAADARGVREIYEAAGSRQATYQTLVTETLCHETLR